MRLQGQFRDVNQEGTGLSDSKGRFLFPIACVPVFRDDLLDVASLILRSL